MLVYVAHTLEREGCSPQRIAWFSFASERQFQTRQAWNYKVPHGGSVGLIHHLQPQPHRRSEHVG